MSKESKVLIKDLPEIPEKVYFTISEVSRLCDLKPHVLRYWEQEFAQLTPTKRAGNRRYYQRKEVVLIRQIRRLLYLEGFTIEGARQRLTKEAKEKTADPNTAVIQSAIHDLGKVVKDLEAV